MSNQSIVEEADVKVKNIPIVFILGHGRSGTTLLQSMMNSHPNIVAPPEHDFIVYLYPRFGKIKHWEKNDILRFVDALYFSPLFSIWLLNKENLTEKLLAVLPIADYPLLCKLVIAQAGKNKKEIKLLSDKNPMNSLFIKKIVKIFPEAKFIHVVRDPRDSVNGHIKRLSTKNTFFVARRWTRYNTLIEDSKQKFPDKVFTIKYEDMVNNIEKTLISLSSFLNVPYSDSMLQHSVFEGLQSLQGNDKFFEELPPEKRNILFGKLAGIHESLLAPVNTDSIAKWKKEMSPHDIAITEVITGKLAKDKYNYEIKGGYQAGVSRFLLWRSKFIYYGWELLTRVRFSSYKLNTKYRARIIRKTIDKNI